MEINLEWKDKYLVGVEEIDTQHKQFFSLIVQAYELPDRSIANPDADRFIHDLMRYAIFHFNNEEKLMTDQGYPKLQEQKMEHIRILKELTNRILEAKSKDGEITPILSFMITWFIDHTTFADRDIGLYIRKHSVSH